MTSTTSNTTCTSSNTTNNHSNNTCNKIGILVVGLGGNNGVTLLAGHVANQLGLEWESRTGRVSTPNWGGCITQLEPKGVHGGVGFKVKGLFDLANASDAAIGGWDIRPTKLGDALYHARILDYDLVRQVRDPLNDLTPTLLYKGIYQASFVGESQHATATHIVDTDTSHTTTLWDQVQHVRRDIRTFIETHHVTGHTTVIWSASVERPAHIDIDVDLLQTHQQLIAALKNPNNTVDISPSMIYATAAALEGCSFVNGGSQNTLGPALEELFRLDTRHSLSVGDTALNVNVNVNTRSPAYLLGTDFKAGQTKFKTAAVEYLRESGLTPMVIASSNHLGNNDMLNLTTPTTLNAKMRVKHSIFEPWHETQLDHQVKVMYVPYMGDDKRDIVEYTSLGFLHHEHTMLTYTRCMDSILCVPLMIDVAVWCDYFARHNVSSQNAAKATAYLFKVPEGEAQGVDPGFHSQMATLRQVLQSTIGGTTTTASSTMEDRTTTTTTTTTNTAAVKITKKMSIQELLHKGLTSGIISEDQVAQLRALSLSLSLSSTSGSN